MNSYYLSDDQLAVLASLFGANVVYGVESKLFSDWKNSSEPFLIDATKRLEEKNLISIQYDGNVRVKSDLYDMISIVVLPSEILITSKTTFDGLKEVNYYYKKNNQIVQMKKGKKLHQLTFVSEVPFEPKEALEIEETLTSKDIETIDGYLDWFDEDGAKEYLKEHTKQPDLVYQIIDRQFDQLVVQYYRWDNNKIIQKEKIMVGELNQKTFEWMDQDHQIFLIKGTEHYQTILQMMNVG